MPGPPGDFASPPERRAVRIALPLLIFAVLLAATVWLWRLQHDHDRREALLALSTGGRAIAARASRLIEAPIASVGRLGHELRANRVESAEHFDRAVAQIVKPPRALRAIGWCPGNAPCRYAWNQGADEAEIRPGADLSRRPVWSFWFTRAEIDRQPRLPTTVVQHGRGHILAVIPVVSGEGTSAAHMGCLVLCLDSDDLLSELLNDRERLEYDVDLSDGITTLLAHGRPIHAGDESVSVEAVKVFNRFYSIRIRPTSMLLAQCTGRSARWVLWAGIPACLLISAALWQVLERRARGADEARRQVHALEELTRTAGLIAAEPAGGHAVLDRLAAATRRILGSTSASISVVDQREKTVTLLATDGTNWSRMNRTMPLEQATGTRNAFTGNQVLIVPDVARDPRVNSTVLLGADIRAALFLPLEVEGGPIGVLYIGYGRVRKFTAAEVRLARLLASQAAVILANYRLAQDKDAALAMQERLQAQREALYQVSSEIYRFDHLDESLQRLADAAPAILGVELCSVSLSTGAGSQMRIHAITGNYASCRWETFEPAGTLAEQSWRQNRVIVVEDASTSPTMHPAYRHRLHVGSAMYLPLLGTDHSPIGLMVLIRHQPGPFSREQMELATVLVARASGAIEQAKLYHEARRYAQSQEMLLRELNHRVKNNLASIVTLLTSGRPPMPDSARLWLNRVTSRIATMARTHELFIGANNSVSLEDLIQKLLPSLRVIKPANVEIQLDIGALPLRLDTDRAVSLAMVINELCWNALEHGSAQHGVLQIRARPAAPGRVSIEIEDEGGQSLPAQPPPESADRPRGMGLRLVEGLVRRELNGTFQLQRTPGGGTVARIDIPLANGHAEGA